MKYKIYVVEKVRFSHEMVIEVPEGADVDSILDEAQENNHIDDVRSSLLQNGCKIHSFTEDGSGDIEMEIPDMDEIE